MCWSWGVELMVLVFLHRASKFGAYLDGASSACARGCHDCKMRGQRRDFLHVRILAMWGLHLVMRFAIAKAASNIFVHFISFP